MRPQGQMLAALLAAAAVFPSLPSTARADWAQVPEIPTTQLFSMFANGDTIAAAVDTAVYLSVDAGATWRKSARPVSGAGAIEALLVHDGRLYAGIFKHGAFVSDDLGASWSDFNQGLVGGVLDSQLDIVDFVVRGDSLFAGTAGAGVYVREIHGPSAWSHFGEVFEPNQASTLNSLALGGGRLLAMGGANGMVFFRDPGDPEWTVSNLDNVGIHAGLQATTAAWTGTGWVVGSNLGLFHSTAGQEPWTRVDLGLGPVNWSTFVTQGGHLIGAFDLSTLAEIEQSDDNGATWHSPEVFGGAFIRGLGISAGQLYAARGDGLWRRALGTVSVATYDRANNLRFALAGPQPVRERARLAFELPESGRATLELFDVSGRAVAEPIQGTWPAGAHELWLDASRLGAGVYYARLTAAGQMRSLRLVHLR